MASRLTSYISPLMEPLARPAETLSHAQKVCRFYKQVIRDIQSRTHNEMEPFRYEAVKMRAEFDKNKDLGLKESQEMLEKATLEFRKKKYPQPITFPNSPGGCAFDRHQPVPDWILDVWHPLEKAQYPKYFALRDMRKREFIERYEKKYGTDQ